MEQRGGLAVAVEHHPHEPASHHTSSHGHGHGHHGRDAQADDGSVKIIMLLSLSLTLMLLPWVSKHPEFLIAPLVLAVTPVVGNGVRPVLKEVVAGLLTTLRLSLGLLTHHHHEAQQQHTAHGHNGHAGHHHHGHAHRAQQHHHREPVAVSGAPPFSKLQAQQAAQQAVQQAAQQGAQQAAASPMVGPSSPWPNPARMPANWPAPHALPDDADGDWSPGSPPDPHQADPASRQHLQQVLAADSAVEAELGGIAAPRATPAAPGGRSGSPDLAHQRGRRSPAGSPAASMDCDQQQQQQQQPHGALEQQHQALEQHAHAHHAAHHVRDPRVLSREAKQQLYSHGGHAS